MNKKENHYVSASEGYTIGVTDSFTVTVIIPLYFTIKDITNNPRFKATESIERTLK